MKSQDDKPIVLLALTALLFLFAAYQVYFFVMLSIWMPLGITLPEAIWIYLKVPGYLWLLGGCGLMLFGQRLGVYIVELAMLFFIVYSCWNLGQLVYFWQSGALAPLPLQIEVALSTVVFWIGIQCFYLWCLRNSKAAAYFNLGGAVNKASADQ